MVTADEIGSGFYNQCRNCYVTPVFRIFSYYHVSGSQTKTTNLFQCRRRLH